LSDKLEISLKANFSLFEENELEISLKANFSLFEENETSKTSSFYKFGKHQQSRYIEIIKDPAIVVISS
jgi:hypothetical protein